VRYTVDLSIGTAAADMSTHFAETLPTSISALTGTLSVRVYKQ
jgi:hypothetical protein